MVQESDTYWEAFYDDDTSLPQYEEDGTVNSYNDIDRSKLDKFVVYRNDEAKIVVDMDPSKRLIYRRRVAQHMDGGQEVVHLAGWQKKVGNSNVQQISFLFDDGHIEVTDGFKEGHDWFDPVNFRPDERVD